MTDVMERDDELVRRILVLTARSRGGLDLARLECKKWPEDVVFYHARIMSQAGLVVTDAFDRHVRELTWEGQDMLKALKDDDVWDGVRDRVAEVGGSVTISVLKDVAVAVLRSRLDLG